MSAAKGPPCEGCRKRVSMKRITRCPWCRRVLCLSCECPQRCARRMIDMQREAEEAEKARIVSMSVRMKKS
jgi:hypothetical protein